MAGSGKVIVTGASGLLGREIYRVLKGEGWDVLGLSFSRTRGELRAVDLREKDEVESVLGEHRPALVVHAAAERRPDVVQNDLESARALNVSATEQLAQLCQQQGCFLVYISSDYVFDGKNAPYAPDASPNPLNAYGQSKLDGEKVVVETCKDSAILRIPVLYGDVESLEESAVTVLFKLVKTGVEAQVCDHQRRYPTHTRQVASIVNKLAHKVVSEREQCRGIWHCSASECITKYGMATAMGEVMGFKTDHLVPVQKPAGGAPRPYDCQLDCASTDSLLGAPDATTFREAVHQVLKSHV